VPKRYLNPPALFPSQQYGFSQIVAARGATTVYVSGQVGWDEKTQIGDRRDLGSQARQALRNLDLALREAGATRDDVVSLRIYIVGEHIRNGVPIREALLDFFDHDRLPTSNWIGVMGLANPDFLIEIEAIAVID
jgi:enamine deaminase RidA (YjgF/YER057c/UK114 family)